MGELGVCSELAGSQNMEEVYKVTCIELPEE